MVYYGHNYAIDLHIDFNLYFDVPKEFLDGGLDLNQRKHRSSVEKQGFDLFHVKYLPLSWLPKFLGKKDKNETSASEKVGG